jgi:hypothetical protein
MQSPYQFRTFEEQASFTSRFYPAAEYDQAKTNVPLRGGRTPHPHSF